MQYKKWNDAFVKHFFDDNKNDEIILYIDEEIINQIGKENELGGLDDFLNMVIVDEEGRKVIYDKNIGKLPKGNVQFNREIRAGSIFEFASYLSEQIRPPTTLPFLNYVILAIYAKANLDETDRSYYRNLNSIIQRIDFNQTKISSNNIKLDVLFNCIKDYDPRFKNEQIGNLTFMGLLKYQVVLSPRERFQFEEILYKNKIGIAEDSTYHQFANRFLSVVSIQFKSLQNKIKLGGKDPVYARWFINRVKSFNHEEFSRRNPEIKQGKQVGEIAMIFNPSGEKHLYFSINTSSIDDLIIGDYKFSLGEKYEDGFSIAPVCVHNKKEIEFRSYKSIENDDYIFSFLTLKGVNFFQKNSINHYQQVLNPLANTETYIVVENKESEISNWEKWKDKNTIGSSESIDLMLTKNLFTDKYILYYAESIEKEYYTRNRNVDPIDYSKELYIKKIGGYRLEGKNTYFDVALPSFQVQNPIKENDDLKITVKTNGNKDVDIKIGIASKGLILLYLGHDKFILQEQEITVGFKLNKLEKQFSFIVTPSKFHSPPISTLFKLNKWGIKSTSEAVWYNGNKIKGSNKIELGGGKIILNGLKDSSNKHNNYFLYLLSALSNKKESAELNYSDIKNIIDLTKVYYETNYISYSSNSYSNFNILRNLIALEYINKQKNDKEEDVYQIVPPSLFKIERSFTHGGIQVYKLCGVRSRRLDQVIIEYCEYNNVAIKYLGYEDSSVQPLEYNILPPQVFLDGNLNLEDLKEYVKKETEIILLTEDEHLVGDSLLNFIESVMNFEDTFLCENYDNFENQEFNEGDDANLPRIIESKSDYKRRGQLYKKKYLRVTNNNRNGVFSEDKIPLRWARLFVAYKHKKVVAFIEKPKRNDKELIFYPDIYIPRTVVVPSVFYKALTNINNSIPKTIKGFILHANEKFNMMNKKYILIDRYRIGDNSMRREKISKILTGSADILVNNQIAYFSDFASSIQMCSVNCSTFSSVNELVLFKRKDEKIIALCDNYKNVYIVSENGKDIKIDGQTLKVKKLIKQKLQLNEIFSKILLEDYSSFETTAINDNELIVEILKENQEEIKILNIQDNA